MIFKKFREDGKIINRAICNRCSEVLKYAGSAAQKYCPECKPIVDREKSRERMRKMRDKTTCVQNI